MLPAFPGTAASSVPCRGPAERSALRETPSAIVLLGVPSLLQKNKRTATGTSDKAWALAGPSHSNGIPAGYGSCDRTSKCCNSHTAHSPRNSCTAPTTNTLDG